jgi:hypothetical protein
MMGFWPFFFLGSGRAGMATVVVCGSFLLVDAIRLAAFGVFRTKLLIRAIIFVVPVVMITGWDAETFPRLGYLVGLSVPALLIARYAAAPALDYWVFNLSLLGCFLILTQNLTSFSPIGKGHLGSVLALSVIDSQRFRGRRLTAIACGILGLWVLLDSPSIGPVLGFATGLLSIQVRRSVKRPLGTFGRVQKSLTIFFALAAVAVVALRVSSEPSGPLGGTQARIEIWRIAARTANLMPRGLALLDIPYFSLTVRNYAHNWVVDAVLIGGIFSVPLLQMMVSRLWLRRELLPPYVLAAIVGYCVSGGFPEAVAVWVGVGLCSPHKVVGRLFTEQNVPPASRTKPYFAK